MPKKTFPGRFESLQAIGDYVIQAARSAGLDDAAVYAVQLAVDEAATNVIEHAYGGENHGAIQISYVVLEDGLEITMVDFGRPFDPEDVPEPETHAPLEDVKPRGLGLFFMRKMMDEVSFDFDARNGNSLTMFKRKK